MSGLWSMSRHPNYLAEILFHCGLLLAALPACRSAAAAWRVLLAPGAFISIMLQSTRGLDGRQLEAYGERPEYREYVARTPRLFFFATPSPPTEPPLEETLVEQPAAEVPTATVIVSSVAEVTLSELSEDEISQIVNVEYPEPD